MPQKFVKSAPIVNKNGRNGHNCCKRDNKPLTTDIGFDNILLQQNYN